MCALFAFSYTSVSPSRTSYRLLFPPYFLNSRRANSGEPVNLSREGRDPSREKYSKEDYRELAQSECGLVWLVADWKVR
jgi:hypothetical protein